MIYVNLVCGKCDFMTEILHVVGSLDTGGVEMLLLNYYKNMDRSKCHWNIITPIERNHKIGLAERELRELGASIYYMPRKLPFFFKQLYVFNSFVKSHRFDVIHCHLDEFSAFYLFFAKKYGLKVRIAHCHIAHTQRGFLFEAISKMIKPFLHNLYTYKFACSKDAALFLYGSLENVYILHNAIDIKKFEYNIEHRNNIRLRFHIEDKIVIGCVGRFHWQKNHMMLIDIFYEIQKCNDAVLLLVGNGKLEREIHDKVRDLNIEEKVIFVGATMDVEQYLSAMDCFVLPSRYEGLGIVYIESLSTNLTTYATLERVPHEVAISDNMHFISIDEQPVAWANDIINSIRQSKVRNSNNDFVRAAHYDIITEAVLLQNKYEELIAACNQ